MNVLLVQSGFLGDVVLSTQCISVIRRQYPESKISILTTPQAAPLVAHHPDVEEVFEFDKRGRDSGITGIFRLARALRRKQFSVVFSLHKSLRTAVLLLCSNIPVRYGFKESAAPWAYTRAVSRKDLDHEVLRNLAIFRSIHLDPRELEAELRVEIPAADRQRAREVLAELPAPYFGIAPGSVWATKRWTPEGFAAVAGEYIRRGYSVVLIGGPGDAEICADIAGRLTGPVLNTGGKLPLLVSAALISELSLLLTNDSAPLHLASASGVAVAAVFCATVPEFGYGPWNVPNAVVGVAGLDCRPCGRHGGNTCPNGTHACQRLLTPDSVVSEIDKLLIELPRRERAGAGC